MADVNLALDLTMNVQERLTHRVKRYGFGDGYEQIARDGINTRVTEYDITTKPLGTADAEALRQALNLVCTGDMFLATLLPFSTEQRRYRVKDSTYSRQFLPSNGNFFVVYQFTLQETRG